MCFCAHVAVTFHRCCRLVGEMQVRLRGTQQVGISDEWNNFHSVVDCNVGKIFISRAAPVSGNLGRVSDPRSVCCVNGHVSHAVFFQAKKHRVLEAVHVETIQHCACKSP